VGDKESAVISSEPGKKPPQLPRSRAVSKPTAILPHTLRLRTLVTYLSRKSGAC
jgi:hypothetical protein